MALQNESEPLGVKVHPIALLSIVDHFERTVGNKQKRRAVGVLLGENNHGVYEVTNSYAVPFDEDADKPGVFFVDHSYHEAMFAMFRKINIKEKVLGWYATGSTFREHDLELNEIWARYAPFPVLLVLDVRATREFELPTKAFYSVRGVNEKGLVVRTFKNIACSVDAYEAEEVGVEHLVREIKDLNMDSLQSKLGAKVGSLLALEKKVETIRGYLTDVLEGRRRQDPQIVRALHQIMSRLPKLLSEELKQVMSTRMNDNYLSIYVSSLVKGVINIHYLLNNRIKALEERELAKTKQQAAAEEKKQEEVAVKSA